MYKKIAFHYSCIILIICLIFLLLTPFITYWIYANSGFNDSMLDYGLITGIIAFIGLFTSFQFAYALNKKDNNHNNDANEDSKE